jgi:hypothetical protein
MMMKNYSKYSNFNKIKANDWIEKLGEVKDEEKKTMIEKIKKQVKDAKEIMFQMFESKGKKNEFKKKDWIHVTNSNNIQTSYKQDSPLYSIKMESTLKQPILNILSVFHEIDLYPSCNHKILT